MAVVATGGPYAARFEVHRLRELAERMRQLPGVAFSVDTDSMARPNCRMNRIAPTLR